MTGFGEISKCQFLGQNGLFLTVLTRKWQERDFLGKSENFTSVSLLCRNFVQETRTNL